MSLKDFLIIFIGSIIFALLLIRIAPQQSSQIIFPLAESFEKAKNVLLPQNSAQIKSIVEYALADSTGTYAIVIKNLKTHETFTQNGDRSFEPASLYKLWVMGATYKFILDGNILEDKTLSREVEELNNLFKISTDSAGLTEGTVTMKVGDAISQMITTSHNYAALLLVSEVRNSRVSSFMREQGFKNSSLGEPPKTTAEDIALFFEKLYQGTMIDSESSKKMLDLLARQKLNDRIPKYLPSNIEVAHKTGELGNFKHDAGIIFGKDPILIVVLSESKSPQTAAERIAQLSKNVYNYFENK
mgnify:CR=1 FL=1